LFKLESVVRFSVKAYWTNYISLYCYQLVAVSSVYAASDTHLYHSLGRKLALIYIHTCTQSSFDRSLSHGDIYLSHHCVVSGSVSCLLLLLIWF